MSLKHRQEAADVAINDKVTFYPLQDGMGSVRLVNYMGSDATIVQSARVSYGDGTKTLREDLKLLGYLYRNQHMSPFEQVVLTFHIKLPMFLARQMVRHRTARLNEVSARYSVVKEEFWMPKKSEVREQKGRNKQGSEGTLMLDDKLYQKWGMIQEHAFEFYNQLIEAGVAREQARALLPVSAYTEWYWQMDLRNLLHFLKLRLDGHAQLEMQYYAQSMAQLTKLVVPETMKLVFDE